MRIFTDRSRKAIVYATKLAQDRGDIYVGVTHLFVGLIESGSNVAVNILKNMGVDVHALSHAIQRFESPTCIENTNEEPFMTLLTKQVIDYAVEEAKNLKHNYVGTEHMLLGMLRSKHPIIAKILNEAGVDYHKALQGVDDSWRKIFGNLRIPKGNLNE